MSIARPSLVRSAAALTALASLLPLAGCFDVTVDLSDDGTGAVEISFDTSGGCQGTGASDDGSARWTKMTSEAGACVIQLEWRGDLLDMSSLRADADEQVEKRDLDLTKVNIESVTFTVTSAAVTAGGLSFARGDLDQFWAEVGTDEELLFTIDEASPWPSFDASAGFRAAAKQAFLDGGAVEGEASATLVIPADKLAQLQAAGTATLTVDFTHTIAATADVPAL